MSVPSPEATPASWHARSLSRLHTRTRSSRQHGTAPWLARELNSLAPVVVAAASLARAGLRRGCLASQQPANPRTDASLQRHGNHISIAQLLPRSTSGHSFFSPLPSFSPVLARSFTTAFPVRWAAVVLPSSVANNCGSGDVSTAITRFCTGTVVTNDFAALSTLGQYTMSVQWVAAAFYFLQGE